MISELKQARTDGKTMKEIRALHDENVEQEDLIEIESAPIKEYYEFLY